MPEYVQFIIPIIGVYPEPVDPENPTGPELVLIAEWQARSDNSDALYGKIEAAEQWLLSGKYEDIINVNKTVEVSHPASPGINGNCHWFRVERILGKDGYPGGAGQWARDKIATLRLTYDLRGWVYAYSVRTPQENLTLRDYTIVSV